MNNIEEKKFSLNIKDVEVIDAKSISHNDETFESYFKNNLCIKRLPIVLKALDVGDCINKWTWSYMKEKCFTKLITAHVSCNSDLDFLNKNFSYKTMQLGELIDKIILNNDQSILSKEEHYYLRSIGADSRKEVCDLAKTFPEVYDDIKIPNLFNSERFFSSVLRIASANMRLWTHYDVMDNILINIIGEKQVTLFSPEDAKYLYIKGDKSDVLDIENFDALKYPLFSKATQYKCILQSNDILFIPALWFHNVLNLSPTLSVNIFWQHLSHQHYDKADVYGNRDPLPAQNAEKTLERLFKHLDVLPTDHKRFYASRLMDKLKLHYDL